MRPHSPGGFASLRLRNMGGEREERGGRCADRARMVAPDLAMEGIRGRQHWRILPHHHLSIAMPRFRRAARRLRDLSIPCAHHHARLLPSWLFFSPSSALPSRRLLLCPSLATSLLPLSLSLLPPQPCPRHVSVACGATGDSRPRQAHSRRHPARARLQLDVSVARPSLSPEATHRPAIRFFGVTLLQTYQYYDRYWNDTLWLKLFVRPPFLACAMPADALAGRTAIVGSFASIRNGTTH